MTRKVGAGLAAVFDHLRLYLGHYAGRQAEAMALVTGYFFADEARTFVERETPGWRAWLEGLAVKPAEPGCPLPSGPGGERLRSDIVRPRTEEER